MQKIYSLFHSFTFYAVAVFTVFAFLLTQNYLVSALAHKYLKESGVGYSKIEGSLLGGIVLHDLKYTEAISMKRLQVKYNFLYFLRPSPKINTVKIQELALDVSKLPESDANASKTSFISFGVATIELNNTKVIIQGETLEFNLNAKGFHYDESVDVKSLSVDLKSSYTNALIKGRVVSNTFQGDSSLRLSETVTKEYLDFLTSPPKALQVKIEVSPQKAVLGAKLEKLSLKADENLSIEDADVKLTYFLNDNTLEADARYKASYLESESVFNQTFSLSADKKYRSKLNASIIKSPTELPFKTVEADIFGDENTLQANIKAGSFDANISSKDYKSFSVFSDNAYFKLDGNFELHTNQEIFQAKISPKLKNKVYKNYPIELLSPLTLMYKNDIEAEYLNIDANLLHAKLSKKEEHLEGSGTFGSSTFSLVGEVKPYTHINISTKTPSIKKLMSELQLSTKDSKILHEGEAEIDTTLNFGETFSMKNDIRIPHYTFTSDSKKSYLIEDISLSTAYKNKKLTISNYRAKYMEHKLYSIKPSTFLIDEDANIIIKEFWFHESLRASGYIDTSKKELDLALKSDSFSYPFNDTEITIQTDLKASIDSSGIQKIKGNIALLNLVIDKEVLNLPFKKIDADILGDEKKIAVKLQTDSLAFHVVSKDYKRFGIQTDNDYFKADGEFSLEQNITSARATLHSKPENELYKNYPLKLFSPIHIRYKNVSSGEEVSIDAKLLHATLLKNNGDLEGFGTLGSSKFTIASKSDENNDTKISLLTKIPSINKFLSELELSAQDKDAIVHDGEADINSTIVFNDALLIQNDIHMPWYRLTMDSEGTYLVEDISFATQYKNKKLILNRYDAKYMQHRFYSDKPSVFLMDENENIEIKKFWIFDNLLARGFINTSKKDIALHLQSDGFTYEGKDANLSAKADVHVSIDSLGKQKIQGTITLLDGVISYVPPQDYIVTDEDIIVAQDVKTDYNANRFVDVSIHSLRPISYKTKDIDIKVTPNIAIYQELNMPLKLLGMATINGGKITAGDKEFVFDKSEVYFEGEYPINPHLNLNLHYYTLDYIDIEIFITNTLSEPVVIFSSKPAMSQNDIMSYILFGEAASSLFESSDGSATVSVSSLLLGTGLKQIFNDTTGVKVDTFNILSNKEGTLGYEIGTRFSKKIRIIYRSDTVSSVIVQYSLSKSLRIDVDVNESGQGVNIIYVKDFK